MRTMTQSHGDCRPATNEHMSSVPIAYHAAMEMVRAALGPPSRIEGNHCQWSLPLPPPRTSVNVLLNGDCVPPVLWVFDPHDQINGVVQHVVNDNSDLEHVITEIKIRLRAGSTPHDFPGDPRAAPSGNQP